MLELELLSTIFKSFRLQCNKYLPVKQQTEGLLHTRCPCECGPNLYCNHMLSFASISFPSLSMEICRAIFIQICFLLCSFSIIPLCRVRNGISTSNINMNIPISDVKNPVSTHCITVFICRN